MMIGKMHIWLFVFMFLAHHLDAAKSIELSDRRQLGGQIRKASSPALTLTQLNKVCGASSVNGRWSARRSSWMASISSGQGPAKVSCGGALINEQYVLTAAQCVVNRNTGLKKSAGDFNVHLGADDVRDDVYVTGENFKVSEVIAHPKFSPTDKKNDIALLRLVKRLALGGFIEPICLPTMSQVIENTKLTIAGWGVDVAGGKPGTILKFLDVHSMSTAKCQMVVGKANYSLSDTQLCADHVDEGKGACHGDEGGPLMLPNADSRAAVIGIISMVQCVKPDSVDIYTKVISYLDWIKKNAQIQ